MTLYLLRHAIAENHAATGRDSDRALTSEGIERLRYVLRTAEQAGVSPDLVLSSPYVRARQTAEQAHLALRCPQPILFSDALVPSAAPKTAWEEIRLYQHDEPLLVVSHDPLISCLLSFLLGVPQIVHSFKKAGLVKLEISRSGARPAAEIQWILTPGLAGAVVSAKD